MESINNLINNKISLSSKNFAVIIGSNPSKGARSPKLWNAAFNAHRIDCKMYPLDVEKKNFFPLLDNLITSKNFIAAAVTNPFKEEALNCNKIKITEIEKKIGAINCFYKKNNNFFGANTDGIAALKTLENNFGKIDNEKILLLGCGGAGKAISVFLADKLENKKNLIIAVRNVNKIKNFVKKINSSIITWESIDNYLEKVSFIINTTNIGNINTPNLTPLSEDQFSKINTSTVFYDINYQPKKSKLLSIAERNGHKIVNGLFMNFYQAVIAFNLSNNFIANDKITVGAMNSIIQT